MGLAGAIVISRLRWGRESTLKSIYRAVDRPQFLTGCQPEASVLSHTDLSTRLLTTRVTNSFQVSWLTPDFSSEGFASGNPFSQANWKD